MNREDRIMQWFRFNTFELQFDEYVIWFDIAEVAREEIIPFVDPAMVPQLRIFLEFDNGQRLAEWEIEGQWQESLLDDVIAWLYDNPPTKGHDIMKYVFTRLHDFLVNVERRDRS